VVQFVTSDPTRTSRALSLRHFLPLLNPGGKTVLQLHTHALVRSALKLARKSTQNQPCAALLIPPGAALAYP